MFVLRVHLEVDNEEGSTINYAIQGLCITYMYIDTKTYKQAPKELECEALHFSTKNGIIQCWKLKLFIDFRVHSQRECIYMYIRILKCVVDIYIIIIIGVVKLSG